MFTVGPWPGAVASGAAAAVALGLTLGRPPVLAAPERLLESPQRRAIMDAIRRSPGLSMSELKGKLSCNWAPLYHHVRILVKAGLVETRRVGRRRVLVPIEAPMEELALVAEALLKGPTVRAVATHIAEHSGSGVGDLTRVLQVSPRTAQYHARRLLDADLLRADPNERPPRFEATDVLRRALARSVGIQGEDGVGERDPPEPPE